MAANAMFLPWLNFILFLNCIIPLCYSHSISPQNIETFYPFPHPTISNPTTNLSIISQSPSFSISQQPPDLLLAVRSEPPISKKAITTVVAVATAAAVLLVCLILCFLIRRRRVLEKGTLETCNRSSESHSQQGAEGETLVNQKAFSRFRGNLNGLILEENGFDVLYWRKSTRRKFKKKFLDRTDKVKKDEEEAEEQEEDEQEEGLDCIQEAPLLHGKSSTSHVKMATGMESVSNKSSSQESSLLPPPPFLPFQTPMKTKQPPLPPPPKEFGYGGQCSGVNDHQVKLKPLHWEKVNTDANHSMVWDKIDDGSFRFNGDLIEALFGSVATNKKSSPKRCTKPTAHNYGGRAQIFILDPRKSQNIAIILKSLTISRQELLDGLMEGKGLDPDLIEKLVRIAPSKEQQSEIVKYDGDPLQLSDAESFIFHLLKAVPTAFTRLNAMFFRASYESEVLRLQDFSQTLELGCVELRKKGLFMKLLEATLKAGNRMNAGTTRGNAQAFNLSSLLKLSDVKSTDGKTTLLHFVVEEIVRSEGKKSYSNQNSRNIISKRQKENEYTLLGLPIVKSLTSEFSNVKKASAIDYKSYVTTCSILSAQISEIRDLLSNEGGEYNREMTSFIKSAEEQLMVANKEQRRVLELVKRTTEYYETGDRENPLGLFVIVKDFISMVDEVCTEISRNLTGQSEADAAPPLKSSVTRRFPCLPEHLMRRSISSDFTDDDF